MKHLFNRFVTSLTAIVLVFLAVGLFLVPWLLSQPNTASVLFGLVLVALLAWWIYHFPTLNRPRNP